MGKSRVVAAIVGGGIMLFAGNAAIPGSSTKTVEGARLAAGDVIMGAEGVVQDAATGAGPMIQSVTGMVQQSGVGNMLGGTPAAPATPATVPPAQQPSTDGR